MSLGSYGFRSSSGEQKIRRTRHRDGTIGDSATVLKILSMAADVGFAFVIFAKRATDSVHVRVWCTFSGLRHELPYISRNYPAVFEYLKQYSFETNESVAAL